MILRYLSEYPLSEFPEAPFVGFLKMGSPGLMIKDPELIKAVLQTDFNSFAKNDFNVRVIRYLS